MQNIFQTSIGRALSSALFCLIIYFVNSISGYPSKEMAVASSIGQMVVFIILFYEFVILKTLTNKTAFSQIRQHLVEKRHNSPS